MVSAFLKLKRKAGGLISLFVRSKTLKIGLSIFCLLLVLAILEPIINAYRLKGSGPLKIGLFDKYLPPSLEHPLGTDHYGRDEFSLLLAGLKYSLLIGIMSGGIATLIGVTIATVSGYFGGTIDHVLNGITNSWLVIPSFPILIVVAMYTRLDLALFCTVLAIFSWPWSARTLRAQILSMKERAYVDLAKVSGMNSYEIMFLEILPNIAPFIAAGFVNSIVGAMFSETGLRMIGLGPGEIPSLGLMLNWALVFGAMSIKCYNLLLAPAGTLILIFISLNLINIGLEEVFNPRLRKITGL